MPLRSFEADELLRVSWVIDAPPAQVWTSLTAPSLVAQWLGRITAGGIAPGSSFVVDHGDGDRCESTVAEYVPDRALVYSWKFPDGPRTTVAWTLSPADAGTALELTHAGLAGLVTSYRDGWMVHLTYLEASARGTPLPLAMFWPWHATIARLTARG